MFSGAKKIEKKHNPPKMQRRTLSPRVDIDSETYQDVLDNINDYRSELNKALTGLNQLENYVRRGAKDDVLFFYVFFEYLDELRPVDDELRTALEQYVSE